MIPFATDFTTQVLIFGGATLISVAAFVGLILVPALGSFGRWWEKAGAVFLSLFVLLALIMVGVALGLILVFDFSDQISDLFS